MGDVNIFYFHEINLDYPQIYVKRKGKNHAYFYVYEFNEHCSQILFIF